MRNKFYRCLLLTCIVLPTQTFAASKLDYGDITKPEFFPIMPWDARHRWDKGFKDEKYGLESIAGCNFNMAGFVTTKDLAECKKLGLSAIVLPNDPSFTSFQYFKQWHKLSDAEIDARVKKMVAAAGKSPVIKGFFLTDEPGAHEFAALGKAVAAVKRYAPGKLAYINLYPDYALPGLPAESQLGTSNYTEYLERFVAEVKPQCLSYDNYRVQYSDDLREKIQAAGYFRNLLEVRRVAQKHGLPFLNIVASNQLRPVHTIPTPANLSLQAYTTLAAGYRGVTWYTFYSRGYRYAPIGNDGEKTLTWNYLQEVNRQIATLAPTLCKLESTGVFFTSPFANDLPVLPGRVVESATADAPLMLGEFYDKAGNNYVMVVNLSLERSCKFTLNFKDAAKKFEQISAVDAGRSPFDAKQGLWLVAGQGVLLKSAN